MLHLLLLHAPVSGLGARQLRFELDVEKQVGTRFEFDSVMNSKQQVRGADVEQQTIASFKINSISDLVPTYHTELLTGVSNTSDEQIDFAH
jgi:hypothetical protein